MQQTLQIQNHQKKFQTGLDNYIKQITKLQDLYNALLTYAAQQQSIEQPIEKTVEKTIEKITNNKVIKLKDPNLIQQAIALLGPQFTQSTSLMNPQQIPNLNSNQDELYDIGIHLETGAIIIANRGVTLLSKTNHFQKHYVMRYITAAIYMPDLGVELANIGIVGDIYNSKFVLRSESACTPSFLFGSQACNCVYQWRCTQELAAALNPITIPNDIELSAGDTNSTEAWLKQQFHYYDGKHIAKESGIGFVLVHLDTQNGMGIGYTPEVFSMDLATRALLRQSAGLGAKQDLGFTMKQTFEYMNLPVDPRRVSDGLGYKITPVLLDFLGAHSRPILLSNNPQKIQGLQSQGYLPERLKAVGEINAFGNKEAQERNKDFGHLDLGSEFSTFEQEVSRLKQKIETTYFETSYVETI